MKKRQSNNYKYLIILAVILVLVIIFNINNLTGSVTQEDCSCISSDVNRDKILDVRDLNIIADCINNNTNCNLILADINQDGIVNNLDLSLYNECHRKEIPGSCYSTNISNNKGIVYVYANNQRIAKKDNTGIYYYHNDNLGSPRAISDSNGNVITRIDYKPFGEEITNSNEKIKYNSKELDSDTNLLYYGARYYNAPSGRFLTADSVKGSLTDPQSLNLYSYTKNNPIKYIDLKGNAVMEPGTPLSQLLKERGWNTMGSMASFFEGPPDAIVNPLSATYGVGAKVGGGALSRFFKKLWNLDFGGKSIPESVPQNIPKVNKFIGTNFGATAENVLGKRVSHLGEYWAQFGSGSGQFTPWKLHVSAFTDPADAQRVMEATIPVLRRYGTTFKVARDLEHLSSLGGTQTGKFMTIYPRNLMEGANLMVDLDDAIRSASLGPGLRIQGEMNMGRTGRIFTRNEQAQRGVSYTFSDLPEVYQRVQRYLFTK